MLRRIIAAGLTAATFAFGGGTANAAIIDLGFVLDGSGSVAGADFTSAASALASALDQIPVTGANQYRVAVTSYGSGQYTAVAPTIITAANIAAVKTSVAGAFKDNGGTDTAGAITYIFNLFNNAGGLSATSLINITTDGVPNSQSGAETAALAAFNAGIDGISFEAVGSGVSSLSAQQNMARIAGLGTSGDATAGVIVTNLANIPNATTTGFVIPVADFGAYGAAISAKIGKIVDDTGGGGPNVVPLPAGLPLILGALGMLGLLRRRAAA